MRMAAMREIAPPQPSSITLTPDQEVWQLGLEDIESMTGRLLKRVMKPASKAGNSTFAFDEQNVLYSKLRPYLNKVVCPDSVGIATTELVPLRPDPSQVHREYLCWYLRSPKFVSWVSGQVNGAKMPRVNMNEFWEHQVCLPTLKEQQRIATILDHADHILAKRGEARELTDQYIHSVFLQMFGDPVTNPLGWPTEPLGNHLEFLTSGSRGWAKYYSKSGDLFLRIQNVGRNTLLLDDASYVRVPESAESRRTEVRPGDVLLSITADLGRTAVIPEGFRRAYINQHLSILRVRGIRPLYLSAFLASAGGQRQIQRLNRIGVKSGLNFDDIRSLRIPVPDDRLQRVFGQVYEKQQRSLEMLRDSLSMAQEFFQSLVQRAFKGEL